MHIMDHYKNIYTNKAQAYQQMIAAEDVDGNLPSALESITTFLGKTVLDLGTGTGRIAHLLADRNAFIIGIDLHQGMLLENQTQRMITGGEWELVQGDMHDLPLPDRCADIAIAGWAIGHLRSWFADDWHFHIGQVLNEMHRMAKSAGALIVIETLGTGSLVPEPPTAELAEYYDWLENIWGFTRQEIQTDYAFNSVSDAVDYTEFFFGETLAEKIKQNNWSRLPEWTGIWVKRTRT
jgi:ubiquinone/menaquinone biosynthesis C-methylase UbiE